MQLDPAFFQLVVGLLTHCLLRSLDVLEFCLTNAHFEIILSSTVFSKFIVNLA